MTPRLADRLLAARHRRFVGRAAELGLFDTALAASELPFSVLHVYGPGGVGKTTLLNTFAAACERRGVAVARLDGRDIDSVPDAFLGALAGSLGVAAGDALDRALLAPAARRVILVDTYEMLTPLDGWLRETWLPQLPETVLVVLAGRQPPPVAWRADPGWQSLVQTVPLRNLSPNESLAYLTARTVPADQHQAVLAFTHGHPLALSLVADVFAHRADWRFEPSAAPDIIKTLLEQFVMKVPGPAHRAALEICALVRLTTESLLAETLRLPDAHELFDWLRGLSFIEAGPLGLFPHDLAREALIADLHWRNPDWYAELHSRARQYYAARLQQTTGLEQQRVLFEYVFLHRDNPIMRPFLEWQETGSALPDTLRADDHEAVVAMVAAHEGADSARLAEHWLAHPAAQVTVYRDDKQAPGGVVVALALPQTTDADRAADPAIAAARNHLDQHAPLRGGESATLFRFWLARDTYQAVSPMQTLLFGNVAQHYLTAPGLAFSFFPCADPDFWHALFTHIDLQRLLEADFEVGGRRYGVFGHDWRVTPPLAWLDLLAEREIATSPAPAPTPRARPVVLSEPEFATAVRDALRDFLRPERLARSPLLRSRMVSERAGANAAEPERIAALQALLREAIESLQAPPRDAKLYRALYRTYIAPAPTQEAAAELLDLPFSTYRRHLSAGLARVVELLWPRDIGSRE
ncbi:MAG TPA: ATP-binding protein [Thermomicrobiales bacterium]|nr:ATP-binding protein [Thermomicrobiales bacterium]